MELERPLLRVPFECLSRDFRLSQKAIEREVGAITEAIAALDPATVTAADIEKLGQWEATLVRLQAEQEVTRRAEARYASLCLKRLSHLRAAAAAEAPGSAAEAEKATFRRQRLDRLVITHLLLNGALEAARDLAVSQGLVDLVDMAVYEKLHEVGDALLGRNPGPGLAWVTAHASKLRRLDSPLPRQLHRFQFFELLRQAGAGPKTAAFEYATKHFGPYLTGKHSEEAAADARADMGMLALANPMRCGVATYEALFREERWTELHSLFFQEAGRALGFDASLSDLDVVLQAGLIALKLPGCSPRVPAPITVKKYGPPAKQRTMAVACPACDPLLGGLAGELPCCRRTKSRLICSLTETVMEGDNYPIALPNGSVYGHEAVYAMAVESDGTVTCPRTHETHKYSDTRRAYVV